MFSGLRQRHLQGSFFPVCLFFTLGPLLGTNGVAQCPPLLTARTRSECLSVACNYRGVSPFSPLGLFLASAAVLCMCNHCSWCGPTDNWCWDFGCIPSRGFAFTGNLNGSTARKKRLPITKLRGNMCNIFELKYYMKVTEQRQVY